MALEEYGWQITKKDPNQTWDEGEYNIQHANSGGGTFARDNSQATMTYLTEYDNVSQFLDVVLGKTSKVGTALRRSASGATFDDVNGSLPEEHPYYLNFFATTADVARAGIPDQKSQGPTWTKALVTVVFRPVTYNILADGYISSELDRYVTKTTESQAEFQTSMGVFYFVGGDQRVLDITPAQTVSATRLTYTWHQVPTVDLPSGLPNLGTVPNLSTILPLVGKVNSTTFDGYGPGSVLFVSWQPKLILPQVASFGNYYWDISYIFAVRDYGVSPYDASQRIGWNFAFDPLRDVWDLYTTKKDGTGKKMYQTGDLNTLFQVNW